MSRNITRYERDPDTVRGPDVALFEDAASFEELHPRYGEVPPILAVEVLSPSDSYGRIQSKLEDYLNNGVKVVWVIDPETQTLRVFEPGKVQLLLKSERELLGGDILPGFKCQVADFFFVPGKAPETTTCT